MAMFSNQVFRLINYICEQSEIDCTLIASKCMVFFMYACFVMSSARKNGFNQSYGIKSIYP